MFLQYCHTLRGRSLLLIYFILHAFVVEGSSTAYYNDFDTNPYTSNEYKKTLRPYLLPEKSPLRPILDTIFHQTRATANINTFQEAGFEVLSIQPRSFILVARHESLKNLLFKVYFDDEKRKKQKKSGWEWFVNRCEGAKKIANIIKKHKIKHFEVAKKWIYPLPITPQPPIYPEYRRKNEILIVTDMKLAPKEKSLMAWKNVTKEQLKELYLIISYAGGKSYREDNIPLTERGTFAFIDTEYAKAPPKYDGILPYLSEEMQIYWKRLIHKGQNRLHKKKTA